jgi:hypothetical protein
LSLVPLLHGIAATVLAAFVVSVWLAIGSLVRIAGDSDDPAAPGSSILVGSAVTGLALALFCLVGLVREGTIATFAAGIVVLFLRRIAVVSTVKAVAITWRGFFQSSRPPIVQSLLVATLWISAISPPRSADAMRYHLAHVRLIILEGRWNPITDFHFGLPFAWSISFLPFELAGLPQASQVLSLMLLVMTGAALVAALKRRGFDAAVPIVILMLLHPFVLRTHVEAGADPYSILVVTIVSLLLLRLPEISPAEAAALGFAAWVGIGSRYQLVAVGIAATVVLVAGIRKAALRRMIVIRFAGGAALGAALASPFYLANATWFGNPVWPLLISKARAESSYAELIAWYYGRSLTGSRAPADVLESAWQLLTWPRLLPMAVIIVASIVAVFFVRAKSVRPVAWFGLVFLLLWVGMQPLLYPRFVLLMLPVSALCVGVLTPAGLAGRRSVQRIVEVALVALVTVTVVLSRDSIRYAFDGDEAAYHRHTWFYPVYRWANANLPRDARVLAIVRSGMTYYLERPYRRADPWIGGEVDWLNVKDGAAVAEVLRGGGYTHIIFETRSWETMKGGQEMHRAIDDALARGYLTPLRQFDTRLYASRATGLYRTARVVVLAVSPAIVGRARSAAIASATTR